MKLVEMTIAAVFVLGLQSDGFADKPELHDTSGQTGHTEDRCEAKGGTVKQYGSYASVCRFKGSSCPSGWKRAKDAKGATWQTAMPVTCKDVDISPNKKCGDKLKSRQTSATGSFTNGPGYNINDPTKYNKWDKIDKDGGHSALKNKECKIVKTAECSPMFQVTEVGCL